MIQARKRHERATYHRFAGAQDLDGAQARRLVLESLLIERVLVGDVESFWELVRPYERCIYGRALSILHNEADAEEVVQESILKAFRNLFQFRNKSKFSTWFIQIAINEARIKLRKDRRYLYESLEHRQSEGDGRVWPNDFLQWRETPLDSLQRKELNAAISRSVNSLPSKYRAVVVLRELHELSTGDTAKTLGISETNVKIRLWRARVQLRDALASSR